MVCQATTAPDVRIRVAAFSCLHEIAANYYAKLPAYMTEVFNMSVKAINGDEEDVALQVGEGTRVGRAASALLAWLCPTRQQLLHLQCVVLLDILGAPASASHASYILHGLQCSQHCSGCFS